MASELSNYLANEILGWIKGEAMPTAPATVYIALFSADPTAAGTLTNEVTTTIRTAGRVAVDWGTVASRALANDADIDFGASVGTATITYGAIMDAATAGNMLSWSPLTVTRAVVPGDPVVIPIGDCAVNFN